MPVVDGVVVLNTRVSTSPRRLGNLAEERLSVNGFDDLAGAAGTQSELATIFDRVHELVADAYRVVGVLVLNARDVFATEVHVEPRIAKNANLLFFLHLGFNELFDVGVVDVEDDHLGGAAGGATALDGSGAGIGATHERHRPRGRATRRQQLLAGTNTGEVESRARSALEDATFFAVPVEDGVHGVVDGQDEAGADLLGRRRSDVEPHRGVEREHLVQQHGRQFVLEYFGVSLGSKVAVLAARGSVALDDSVEQLLQAPLSIAAAHGATEVLGGDNRAGVHAPEVRELDATLLEHGVAGLPVGLDDVATFPVHLVVGVNTRRGVEPFDREPGRAGTLRCGSR